MIVKAQIPAKSSGTDIRSETSLTHDLIATGRNSSENGSTGDNPLSIGVGISQGFSGKNSSNFKLFSWQMRRPVSYIFSRAVSPPVESLSTALQAITMSPAH